MAWTDTHRVQLGEAWPGVDATELNERNGEASKDDLFTDFAVHRVDGCCCMLT